MSKTKLSLVPQISSNLMKTSFKNEESGGSINRYITICAIQAIDTTNLSKRSRISIIWWSINGFKRFGTGKQEEIPCNLSKRSRTGIIWYSVNGLNGLAQANKKKYNPQVQAQSQDRAIC